MSKLKGKFFRIYVGSSPVAIGNERSSSFQGSTDVQGNSDKDSGGWVDNEVGDKSWQISGDCSFEEGDSGLDELETAWANGTEATAYSRDTSDRKQRGGSAIVTGFEISGTNGELTTCSVTLTGTGAYTKSTF